MKTKEDEWLWGWDPTPGIVSVWAEPDGRALVWRRVGGRLVREQARFRPWALLPQPEPGAVELARPGALRWLLRVDDGRRLAAYRDRGGLVLPFEEQYLVA